MTEIVPFIVDSLALVGRSLFGSHQDPDDLFSTLEGASIGGVVLAPQRPTNYHLAPANDRVAKLVAVDPVHRRQLARVDPNHENALAEIRRCANELGVSGFYLSPREEVFSINGSAARGTLDAIAEFSLPVVIETAVPGVSEVLQVAEVAARYPDISFVMTNGGQMNMSGLGQGEAFMALEACSNTFIQTSGVYRQDFIDTVVNLHGAGRVMFASFSPTYQVEYELLRVLGASLTSEERLSILGGTARSLFWKEPKL